ncbi:retrotransposon protein, putative, ty1-copia subclass [Tanacetum coccineum]|uniref:Retrotransposon protein, putative, ty1-copia subclass n=1 Tax=Tanacetum coccineum TaxID=301880 RepID=A0ABQ4Z5D8_9ASTR
MASSINPELQKTFEKTWAYEMNQQLKEMFQTKACKERLDAVKSPMAYKLKLGASICAFILEMKVYFDRLTSRVSKPPQDPQFYYGFHIEEDKISDSTLSELDEPANYKEAMASPEAAKWKGSPIEKAKCSQFVSGIFKKKTDMDGKVHTYKARLVAKGYTQTHEIDYEETFSPVAKIKSIRIMLAIAAFHDYEIW